MSYMTCPAVPDGFIIDNSAAAVTATGPGDMAVRFDGVQIDAGRALTDYIRSGWVAGLDNASVHQQTINGNEAAALGAVYAGATVASWYPITPSTSLAEAFERHATKLRRSPEGGNRVAVVQAEDELSAAGMAIGANWNGARAFTATSGPGVSILIKVMAVVSLLIAPLLS